MVDDLKTALIADDDEFFRAAMIAVLTKNLGFSEVTEAASLDEAIEKLDVLGGTDLALFDLAMPGMKSPSNLRAVRECFPHLLVVVVSASRARQDVLQALEAGVHGYVPKSLGVAGLSSAISLVLDRTLYVPPFLAEFHSGKTGVICQDAHEASTTSGDLPSLTPRQREVLALVVAGKSNKEIARALNLGEGTVKVHMAALFRALNVTSRSAAAAIGALRMNQSDSV